MPNIDDIYKSKYTGEEIDALLDKVQLQDFTYDSLKDKPIINQDLLIGGFTPQRNTYYRHTGTTANGFAKGIIYLYSGGKYTAIKGGGKDGTTFTPSVSEDGIISWTNDGGKGNPAPVNIKGPKGDSGVASGTVNSNEPGNSDTNGYTQKAVNGIVQNPNLLINPDFAINQRGQESYQDVGYTVDRWTLDAGATLTPQNDGIKLIGGCRQFYEEPNKLWGKTVTLSFKTASGITSKSGTLPDVAPSANITLVSTNTDDSGVSAVVRYVSNRIAVVISATTETNIYWVKLEIGSVATAFSAPSIAEELIKCQRYYQIVRNYSRAVTPNSLYAPYTNFAPTMRVTPSCKVYGVNRSGIRQTDEKTVYNIDTNTNIDIARNPQYISSFGCLINASGVFTANNGYMWDVVADAEL